MNVADRSCLAERNDRYGLAGNEIAVQSEEITISQHPLEIGELIPVQSDSSQKDNYKIIAKDSGTVTVNADNRMKDTLIMVFGKRVE